MADRYDKFTERTQRVLRFAEEEAKRFNHNYIDTEHILLGLVREGDGIAAKVLANLGVDLNKVRSKVDLIIGRGHNPLHVEIAPTLSARRVINLAIDEARLMEHNYIGTEHILLGLVREGDGIAARVLESLGVNLERVRAETTRVLSHNSEAQKIEAKDSESEAVSSSPLHDAAMIAAGLPILIEGVSEMSAEEVSELQLLAEDLLDAINARWTELQIKSVED